MRLRFHKNSCAELGMRQACAHWLSKCPCEERTLAPSSKRLSQEQMLGDYTAKVARLNMAMAERRIMSKAGSTSGGQRICFFFRSGKCAHRSKAHCTSGVHPEDLGAGLKANKIKCCVPGCVDGLDGCPFDHCP